MPHEAPREHGTLRHPVLARAVHRRFAVAAPPTTVLLGALAIATPLAWQADAVAGAIALAALLVLSVVAAAVGGVLLSAATRWAAVAGAAVIAALLVPRVDAIEQLSLPCALAPLGGAALAMRRRARAGRPWPAVESAPWIAGLVVAVAPSLIATPTVGRAWLVVAACLLAATGIAAVAAPPVLRLAVASTGILLAATTVSAVRATLALADPTGFVLPLVAGTGIAAVGAVTVWRRLEPAQLAMAAGVAGSAVIAFAVAVHADGDLVPSLAVAVLGAAAAMTAAAVLGRPGWRQYAGTLTIGATVVALTGVGSRLWWLIAAGPQGFDADAWILGGCAIVVAVGAVALRGDKRRVLRSDKRGSRSVLATVVGVAFAATAVFYAALEGLLIVGFPGTDGAIRTATASVLLTAAAVAGALLRGRIGGALLGASIVSLAVVAAISSFVGAADPVEILTVPPAAGLLAVGARRMRRGATVRSWPALGPGLALLTVPSLAYDFAPNDLWRIVALGVVSIALVVLGATRRLQAPLVVGAVVLVIHAVAQLWPWISLSYSAVPWWLWVGLGGILLIVIAARYERQLVALRTAYASVTSLR